MFSGFHFILNILNSTGLVTDKTVITYQVLAVIYINIYIYKARP